MISHIFQPRQSKLFAHHPLNLFLGQYLPNDFFFLKADSGKRVLVHPVIGDSQVHYCPVKAGKSVFEIVET